MLTHIKGILDQEQLAVAHRLIAAGQYADGSTSAGLAARRVKHNEELALNTTQQSDLNNLVMGSLVKNPVYRSAVMPLKIAAPYYAHYTEGMSYGEHVDDPIMGVGDSYRTDVSITVFLNEPDEYEGGELTISSQYGEVSNKLPAGDAILYPSGSLHQIKPISKGTRLVAVTWAQSMIRDTGQRELLYNLSQARDELIKNDPESPVTQKVSTSYINLVRMWAEV